MIAWVKVMEKTEWTEQVLYTKWVSRVRQNGRNSIFRTHNVNWVFNRSHVGDFFSKKLPHGQDAGQSSDVSTHVTVATWKWESWALPWFSSIYTIRMTSLRFVNSKFTTPRCRIIIFEEKHEECWIFWPWSWVNTASWLAQGTFINQALRPTVWMFDNHLMLIETIHPKQKRSVICH